MENVFTIYTLHHLKAIEPMQVQFTQRTHTHTHLMLKSCEHKTNNEWMNNNPLEMKLWEKCYNIFTTKSLNPRRKHFKFKHTWHHARLVWRVKMELVYDNKCSIVFGVWRSYHLFIRRYWDEFTFIHLFNNNSIHSVFSAFARNRVQFYQIFLLCTKYSI